MSGFFGGSNTTTTQTSAPQGNPQDAWANQLASIMLHNQMLSSGLQTMGTGLLGPTVQNLAGQGPGSLASILQMSPAQLGLPGAVSGISDPLFRQMSPGVGQAMGMGNDPRINQVFSRMMGQPGQSPELARAFEMLSQSGGQNVNLPGGPMGGGVGMMDPQKLLAPLTNQFNKNIMPGISSSALAAGAFGGGRQNEMTAQASGRFGQEAAGILAQNQAALENSAAALQNAGTNAYSAQVQAALGKAGLGTQAGQQMGNLALAMQQLGGNQLKDAGSLALNQGNLGIQGLQAAGMLAPILQQLGMAGPTQAATTADAQQKMQLAQAKAPLDLASLLFSSAGGMPFYAPQFAPQGATSTSTVTPSAGAQAGSAFSSLLPIALMLGSKYLPS